MLRSLVAGCLLCSVLPGQALAPLRAAGNMTTIELSPLLVATGGLYPGEISVINGDPGDHERDG